MSSKCKWFLLLLLILVSGGPAQALTPMPQWSQSVAIEKDQSFILRKVLPHRDGGAVRIGTVTQNLNFQQEIRIEALDVSGQSLWVQRLDDLPAALSIYLSDAALSSEGDYYILNTANNRESLSKTGSLITQVSAEGQIVWQRDLSFATSLNTYGLTLKADAEGGVLVAGLRTEAMNDFGFQTLCFVSHLDRSGQVLWSKSFPDVDPCAISDFDPAIQLDDEQNIYLAMEESVVKLDRNGEELWRVSGRAMSISLYQNILYVTSPQKTWALNKDGLVLWEFPLKGGLYGQASAVGFYALSTNYPDDGSASRLTLQLYGLEGKLIWSKIYPRGVQSFAYGLRISAAGDALVYGEVWRRKWLLCAAKAENSVVSFDRSGKELWHVGVKNSESAASFLVEDDGSFIVGDLSGMLTRYEMSASPTKCPWYWPLCHR